VERDRAQLLVTVAEDVAGDLDEVADGPLRGEAACVDGRLRVLDLDPRRRRRSLRLRHSAASIR